MPKLKTRSAAKKRLKVKKSGKVKHGKAYGKHLFTHGKTPKATDTVSVNYRGTLVSGKEFDASNGKPVSSPT